MENIWQQLNLDSLLAHLGSARQRSPLKAMIFAHLLHASSKIALKSGAGGTLLACAFGLRARAMPNLRATAIRVTIEATGPRLV